MEIDTMNIITLAYMGDAIYEVYIRQKLIEKGIAKVEELQKEAVKYVSAKGQASFLKKMIDENVLTEQELEIVRRGRNNKRSTHPKHTDIGTYKYSTGLEALIGYLYFQNKSERLMEILNKIEVN